VVIAANETTSTKAGEQISKALGGVRLKYKLGSVTDQDFLDMRAPTGGGLVCCTIIEAFNKNFKKAIVKHGNYASLVLVDCEDEDIDSLLLPHQTARLKGMVKSWKKLKFQKVISATSLVFRSIEEAKESEKNEQLQAVLKKLIEVSNSAPKLDVRPGLLVFFPQLPGSGKTSLTNEVGKKELKRAFSEEKREILISMGDKVKGKYWQAVKATRSSKSSAVFIADKNAPPNAWSTVASSIKNGIGVAVFPDSAALSTTAIQGIISIKGIEDTSRQHHYPFSLPFLAICMARVVSRPAKSHPGGLDCGLSYACWVVIKFFAFYRSITSDELFDTVKDKILKEGGICSSSPVQVPFFREGCEPHIPQELQEVLEEALKIQFGYDICRKDPCILFGKVQKLKEIEDKLRALIKKHKDSLFALTSDETESRNHFLANLKHHLVSGPHKPEKTSFVKIVSLDIPNNEIHKMLKQELRANGEIGQCLKGIGISPTDESKSSCLVENTHVTMVHHENMIQKKIRLEFDPFVGKSVKVVCKRLFWSESVAAIEVDFPSELADGTSIPPPKNEFQHITVWVAKGKQAVVSNQLPALFAAGKASAATLTNQRLSGKISFWDESKKSKK